MSVTFQPSIRVDGRLPDTTIISSNHVYFYVHRHCILCASSNGFDNRFFDVQPIFGGFLPTICVSEGGDVVNVVLHTIYNRSCVHFYPALETVEASLTALIKYGVAIGDYAAPTQPLYQLLTSHAPYRPIETYAIAGQHQLEDVAVIVSGHLLSYDLSELADGVVSKMGPVYLKRLVLLHQSCISALRQIVITPPAAHPTPPGCTGVDEHGALTRAWAHATAQLVWDATPSKAATLLSPSLPDANRSRSAVLSLTGISANALRTYLERIGETITCESCRAKLVARIQEVMVSWSAVKVRHRPDSLRRDTHQSTPLGRWISLLYSDVISFYQD